MHAAIGRAIWVALKANHAHGPVLLYERWDGILGAVSCSDSDLWIYNGTAAARTRVSMTCGATVHVEAWTWARTFGPRLRARDRIDFGKTDQALIEVSELVGSETLNGPRWGWSGRLRHGGCGVNDAPQEYMKRAVINRHVVIPQPER